jgi:hypothetical protein
VELRGTSSTEILIWGQMVRSGTFILANRLRCLNPSESASFAFRHFNRRYQGVSRFHSRSPWNRGNAICTKPLARRGYISVAVG